MPDLELTVILACCCMVFDLWMRQVIARNQPHTKTQGLTLAAAVALLQENPETYVKASRATAPVDIHMSDGRILRDCTNCADNQCFRSCDILAGDWFVSTAEDAIIKPHASTSYYADTKR